MSSETSDTKIFQTILNIVNEHRLSPLVAMSVISGDLSLEQALQEKRCRARALQLSKAPPSRWPEVTLKWDESPANWHRSIDGSTASDFGSRFPNAELAWVNCALLHDRLGTNSTRKYDPFSRHYKSKSAGIVAHAELGGKLSPPLVTCSSQQLHIAGGNHRLALAKHMGQKFVPILYLAGERHSIEQLLPLYGTREEASDPPQPPAP